MSDYVIGIAALFAAAFALFAILSLATPFMKWRFARIYWICAIIAAGALFGPSVTAIALGLVVSTVILVLMTQVAKFLDGRQNVQPHHHHHYLP